jgi:hypothetical protein
MYLISSTDFIKIGTYIIEVQQAKHEQWLILLKEKFQWEGPEHPLPHPFLVL